MRSAYLERFVLSMPSLSIHVIVVGSFGEFLGHSRRLFIRSTAPLAIYDNPPLMVTLPISRFGSGGPPAFAADEATSWSKTLFNWYSTLWRIARSFFRLIHPLHPDQRKAPGHICFDSLLQTVLSGESSESGGKPFPLQEAQGQKKQAHKNRRSHKCTYHLNRRLLVHTALRKDICGEC